MRDDSSDLHELAGAYALDALPTDEVAVFERHLEICAACQRDVAEMRDVAAVLGEAQAREPAPELRRSVLRAVHEADQDVGRADGRRDRVLRSVQYVAQEPAAGPGDRPATTAVVRSRWPERLAPLTAAAAALVLVLGMGTAITRLDAQVDQLQAQNEHVQRVLASGDLRTVALSGEGALEAHLVVSEVTGEAILVAQGVRALDRDQTYELWLIDDGGARSAGLFLPDEDGSVVQLIATDVTQASAVGVTVEPSGGSPQPTSEPVLLGEV